MCDLPVPWTGWNGGQCWALWWHYQLEGHSFERIPPPPNAWSMRTYQAHYNFEICYISFLALSLNGEESLWKLNNSRICIHVWIFTKIESIRPCHTPNISTEFHPNPSTFWDIVLYWPWARPGKFWPPVPSEGNNAYHNFWQGIHLHSQKLWYSITLVVAFCVLLAI